MKDIPNETLLSIGDRLPTGYTIRLGSGLDRALLVKFMQRTYQELYPHQDFSHLAQTIEQYFSSKTPLWWVDFSEPKTEAPTPSPEGFPPQKSPSQTVGCLWVGNSIDQVSGDRHAHIFLLYVAPQHRRQGIGSVLVHHGETWARNRGDRQIGLHVFATNQPALRLYEKIGYKALSLWMVKPL